MARFAPKPNSLREKMNQVYFAVFTPAVTRLILAVSVLLIIISFLNRQSLAAPWYHFVEGLVTFLFVSEVGLRLAVMRSGFWESPINIAEAVMCFFCVVVFSVLSFAHHTTRLEHNTLIFLRYSAQLLRLKALFFGGVAGSSDIAMSSNIEIHAPGQGGAATHNSGVMNL